MDALELVWNRRARRLRLPWRLAAITVIVVALALAVSIAAPAVHRTTSTVLGFAVMGAEAAAASRNLVFVASQVVVYLGAVVIAGRFVDRRRIRDFGFHVNRRWWLDLGFGLLLGAGLMSGVFLLELIAGWVSITGMFVIDQSGFAFWPWFGWAIVTLAVVGVTEELLARGYLITNLAEGVVWFDRVDESVAAIVALVGSSLVFAVGHGMNPGASPASTAGILLAAGMLGLAYVLTGELAVPIGIHTTWNLFQGPVYGFPVSGLDLGLSIVGIEQRGPALLTGGAFGPEAGLVGAAASLVGTGAILGWVRWRSGGIRIAPTIGRHALHDGDR